VAVHPRLNCTIELKLQTEGSPNNRSQMKGPLSGPGPGRGRYRNGIIHWYAVVTCAVVARIGAMHKRVRTPSTSLPRRRPGAGPISSLPHHTPGTRSSHIRHMCAQERPTDRLHRIFKKQWVHRVRVYHRGLQLLSFPSLLWHGSSSSNVDIGCPSARRHPALAQSSNCVVQGVRYGCQIELPTAKDVRVHTLGDKRPVDVVHGPTRRV
jgi:hypothetical protein